MAAEEQQEDSERTEEATTQRREDFRKQGMVPNSREIGTVAILFGSTLMIWALGRFFFEQIYFLFSSLFSSQIEMVSRSGDFMPAAKLAVQKGSLILAPILAISGILSVLSSVVQVGFMNKEDALDFKLAHIDPIAGFKRIFSVKSLMEGFKSVLKLSIIILITYFFIKGETHKVLTITSLSILELFFYTLGLSGKLVFGILAFLVVVAVIDYGYQWWDLEKQMMMTKQEVKEELKSREGDPQIKARIRRIQREMAQKRMMEKVPTADVVITNPTHIAVALKYDAKYPAPQLVAKGADLIAEKIKKLARENNVPVVENVPLARAIFKTLKIGQVIPRELYNAVAEVLAFVYKMKKKVIA